MFVCFVVVLFVCFLKAFGKYIKGCTDFCLIVQLDFKIVFFSPNLTLSQL